MTEYRDDRAALKQRNVELEDEVAALREQLATRDPHADAPAPLVTGLAERPLPRGLIVVGLFALTTAFWMAAGPIVGTELAVLTLVVSAIVTILSRLFVVPGPHEALVVSGTADPPFVVARRPFVRAPLLHTTHTLELSARLVPIAVDNAYAEGGVPVHVSGYAIVGVDPDEPGVRRAVERFLESADLDKVAAQTLAGVAREMIAVLTPEELSVDRLGAAERLKAEAEQAMAKLGLVVLDLGIETVSDSAGYLDALPRPRIAEALRDAERLEHEGATS